MTARIVSLVPAGTEIVAALGASHLLAGISHECDFPPAVATLPRVSASAVSSSAASADIDASVRALVAAGSPVFSVDAEQLAALAPTVVITQSLCDVCAVSDGHVRRLADVLDPAPELVPLVGSTLSGVWDDIRSVGVAIGRSAEAAALLLTLDARLRRVHDLLAAARAPRPRVAVIEWLHPLFAAGHWTPELVRRAGGVDVLAEPGTHSVRIELARIRDAEPDLLLFAPCGFDVHRAAREARALLATPEWAWARALPAWALDGNALTSRAGPRLADAVEVIAAIVSPSLFAVPATGYALPLNPASSRP